MLEVSYAAINPSNLWYKTIRRKINLGPQIINNMGRNSSPEIHSTCLTNVLWIWAEWWIWPDPSDPYAVFGTRRWTVCEKCVQFSLEVNWCHDYISSNRYSNKYLNIFIYLKKDWQCNNAIKCFLTTGSRKDDEHRSVIL